MPYDPGAVQLMRVHENRPSVLVIGAGAAGLSAARALARARVRVTVIEARPRIGGRMDTRKLGDGTHVDLGAAWVYGKDTKKNPLTPPAVCPPGSTLITDWDNCHSYEAVGTTAAPSKSPSLSEAAEDDIDRLKRLTTGLLGEKQSKARAATMNALARGGVPPPDSSLWDAIGQLKSKRFPGVAGLSERERLLLRWAWALEAEHEYATPMEQLSMQWWDSDESQAPDMSLWRFGYGTLAAHLAEEVTDIRLGCRVEAIEVKEEVPMDAEPTAASSEEAARSRHIVQVRLAGGECLVADACVVTLPLGVLKSGAVRFEPGLPEDKLAAISRLGMGVLNKVVLRFDRCFWATSGKPEPHVLYRVPTQEARNAPDALESPEWINLRPVTGANVLVAYYVGETAVRMEAKDDDDLRAYTLQMLSTMYGERVVSDANVLECVVSRWSSDEFACGAYSFVAVGATPLDRAVLARPEGPLLFAGEATSHGNGSGGRGGFASTVYGAYLSGLRAAAEAGRLLGLSDSRSGKKR